MASVLRGFSQPLTRNFVLTQDTNNGEAGAYFFTQGDINSWAADNAQDVTQLGSIYVIPASRFVSVTQNLDHSNSNIDDRKTLKDMGKEIIIGTPGQPRLLVLRKVQSYTDSANANGATDSEYNGYVVVENNAEDLGPNIGRFTVRVARV
jgi:hypothetical protein